MHDDDEDHDYDGNDEDGNHDNDHEVYEDVDQIHDWLIFMFCYPKNRDDHNAWYQLFNCWMERDLQVKEKAKLIKKNLNGQTQLMAK